MSIPYDTVRRPVPGMLDIPGISIHQTVPATFEEKLALGRTAENNITRWLNEQRRSWALPVYEMAAGAKILKGPRLLGPDGRQLVMPDLIVAGGETVLVESKCKSAFTWYRKDLVWETGIDLHFWNDYLEAGCILKMPIWLLFLHKSDTPSAADIKRGSPPKCPRGLFIGNTDYLKNHINHKSAPTISQPKAMVYWRHSDLRLLVKYPETEAEKKETGRLFE